MPRDNMPEIPTSIRLQVEGLSCAGCVRRAETAIAGVKGVNHATVNLATGKADVEFRAPATTAAIGAAMEKAGYPAGLDEVSVEVEGATCASCVNRIETAIKSLPGVSEAVMNLATGRASIRYYSGTLTVDDIAAAVAGAGYKVVADTGEQTAPVDRHKQDVEQLTRSVWIAFALGLPVFVAEMGGHLIPEIHHFTARTIGAQTSWVLQFILTSLVLIFPGRIFFTKGFPALVRRAPDMNSLVALGATAAWAYSSVATFAPGLLPETARNVYFESAAVIVVLILLGRLLEARAKGRTGDAIRHLVALAPDTATVERDGNLQTVPIETIRTGEILHLKPGERLAVDGIVLSGHSYVDESMITGEPVPVEKRPEVSVVAGTINGTGALTYRATAVGRDTMLSRIVAMVEDAQGAKLPIQAQVDKITAWFVPAVMGVATLTVLAWLAFGPDPALTFALVAGVAVLIIACPCAMGLATPTSIMVGTGRAAELGVLFRRGDALQALQGVGIIAVDKTGTLTEGRPELTDLILADGFSEAKVLPLLAAVEAQSEHPIARAITRAAADKAMRLPKVTNFTSLTGNGVRANVGKKTVLIGADRLMLSEGIDLGRLTEAGQKLALGAKTPLYAAIDGQAVCAIAVADPIKPTTPAAISALHDLGLKVAMLTGDNAATAAAIATELGIDHVEAEVLPEGKVTALKSLRSGGQTVAFIGDGINDAPALAEADVGLAVGTGTDIAIESADIVLMSGDLRGVVNAVEISRATMRNIRQNLFWAFGYNVVLIPVAAGALYPLFGTMLSPALAAGAMALSSVFVVSNALRLRFIEPVMKATV